mmetsp:Transcript_3729/g.10360  ORF Transcript_3729/g.10360 Transcript_3729/m.10360 type:complete len:218 (-) Transcript_3729:183-836(-)
MLVLQAPGEAGLRLGRGGRVDRQRHQGPAPWPDGAERDNGRRGDERDDVRSWCRPLEGQQALREVGGPRRGWRAVLGLLMPGVSEQGDLVDDRCHAQVRGEPAFGSRHPQSLWGSCQRRRLRRVGPRHGRCGLWGAEVAPKAGGRPRASVGARVGLAARGPGEPPLWGDRLRLLARCVAHAQADLGLEPQRTVAAHPALEFELSEVVVLGLAGVDGA